MICGLVYTLRVATVEPFFTLYLPSEAFLLSRPKPPVNTLTRT